MSESCYACGKGFSWISKKHLCDMCQKAFCKDCTVRTNLSWGSFGDPQYRVIVDSGRVRYKRVGARTRFSKVYTLCKQCEEKIRKRMVEFQSETKQKFDSMVVTSNSLVPGYEIIARLGFIEYPPRRPRVAMFDPYRREGIAYLKKEALKRGANALINFKRTYIEKIYPPKLPNSRPTPLDFVPGYRERKYRQRQQPLITRSSILKAEAVLIQKIKDAQ